MTVAQRSPGWVVPRHDEAIPPWRRALLSHLPIYSRWYRASWHKMREDFFYAVTQADSHHAAGMRKANEDLMRRQLPNRPDLWEALTPDYLPGCKRSIVSDDYYPSLIRPNVTLETRPIQEITPSGVQFEGQDSETEVDIIVLATGYQSLVRFHHCMYAAMTATNPKCYPTGLHVSNRDHWPPRSLPGLDLGWQTASPQRHYRRRHAQLWMPLWTRYVLESCSCIP